MNEIEELQAELAVLREHVALLEKKLSAKQVDKLEPYTDKISVKEVPIYVYPRYSYPYTPPLAPEWPFYTVLPTVTC